MTLSGQKILVTGASGFIGSHLCRRLCESGAEVHGVSRKDHSEDKNSMRWWQGDLIDIHTVRKILNVIKPNIIFHLASYVAGARSLELVLPTFYSNLTTTVNLLTAVNELECDRIILTGSLEEPEAGDSEAVPCSPYAVSKWSGSAYARMFHELYKTPVTIARLFMVYGPGQEDRHKLIPYVTLSLLRKEAPTLSSGQRMVDWIYVEDVVDGLLTMAQAPEIEGRTIELGSGSLVSVRTVVENLVNMINPTIKPLFGELSDRPMEQVRVANTANSYAKIGWKPMTTLEKGLSYTLDWYKNQKIENKT